MGFCSGHSLKWLFFSTVFRLNQNLEFWFLWREENWRNWRKTLEPGPQWREANPLTTMPSLLPWKLKFKVLAICFSYVGTTMVLFSKYGYQWAKLVAVPKDVWVLQSWDNLRRWHLWLKMNKKQISFCISHTVHW